MTKFPFVKGVVEANPPPPEPQDPIVQIKGLTEETFKQFPTLPKVEVE